LLRVHESDNGPKRQDQIDEVLSGFGQLGNCAGPLLRTDLTRLTQIGHSQFAAKGRRPWLLESSGSNTAQ